MVLVLFAILSAAAVPYLGDLRSQSQELNLEPTLASVQTDIVRLSSDGTFPSDVADQVNTPGITVTSGAASNATTVSVALPDASTVILVSRANNHCLALMYQIGGAETWGRTSDSNGCSATNFIPLRDAIVGTAADPTELG